MSTRAHRKKKTFLPSGRRRNKGRREHSHRNESGENRIKRQSTPKLFLLRRAMTVDFEMGPRRPFAMEAIEQWKDERPGLVDPLGIIIGVEHS